MAQKKTTEEEKWKNPILMEIEKITLDCHLNSISQEEARDEIWKLFHQILQRFIEETKISEVKLVMDESCPFCGKKKWECETELAIDKEIEFEKLNEFDCHRITYNQVARKLNQKQQQWLKDNL